MRYTPTLAVTQTNISDLDWNGLNAAVQAGSVGVEDATMETIARYELQRRAIELRLINPRHSRMQCRAALLEHFNQLATNVQPMTNSVVRITNTTCTGPSRGIPLDRGERRID